MAISAKFGADFTSFQAAVTAAETKLVSFESGATKVKSALERMETSLSGRRLIQDATLAVQAVENIGGASKLTESELQRLSAQVGEASSKMRAMGLEVPQSFQKITDAAGKLTPQLSMADRAAGLLGSAFGQFTAANLAASAISSVTVKLGEFIDTGMKLQSVEQAFARLTSGVKQSGSDMLAGMTSATRGMVSNYDLMLSANKAMLLGLPVTSDAMAELASSATSLGRAMGQDATKSLDDLIVALGRSSPMILDNLGLTVKVGEANDAYAAKMKIVGRELTEAEKKMAFYEAAMEAARKKTKELGDQTLTLGEVVQSAWVKIGNAVSETASNFNVGLGAILTSGAKGLAMFAENALKFGVGQAIMTQGLTTTADAAAKAAAAIDAIVSPVNKTTVDMAALREQMLKSEEARIVAPAAVAAVKDLGETAVVTTKAIRGLSQEERDAASAAARHNQELERENELLAKIAAQNKAISASGRLYQIDAEGNKHFVGGDFENDLVGRVTPISASEASNPKLLQDMIARLAKSANEWRPPAADTFRGEESAFGGMPNYMRYQRQQLEAAQKHADDLRQLEYLQQLLSVIPNGQSGGPAPLYGGGGWGGGPTSFTINISGVWDSRSIRELKEALDNATMVPLKIARQLGGA